MPRAAQVPSIGLYLDQTVKYINEVLSPLGCIEVTPSMISNYVKKKYIDKPVRKLYSREQIMCLMMIALAKLVLSMDNIDMLLKLRMNELLENGAYDTLCARFETFLRYVFGEGEEPEEFGARIGDEQDRFLSSLLTAVAHYIYLNDCLENMGDPDRKNIEKKPDKRQKNVQSRRKTVI